MKQLWTLRGIAFVVLIFSYAMARTANAQQEPEKIPLKEIWGYHMPGTRDLLKIEDRTSAKRIEEIRHALSTPPPKGKDAPAGFAVAGSGANALREAHAVLVEGKKPREKFPADSEISAAFLSYQVSSYVHLHQVSRKGDEIVIRFKYVPHETAVVTEHFAIIPLRRLQRGAYRVKVELAPMDQRFIDLGFKTPERSDVRRQVCGSFSFSVTD